MSSNLDTLISDLPDLPEESINKLTDRAKTLTKGELIILGKNRPESDKLLNLTLRDVKSVEQCFKSYGAPLGGGAVGGGSCCSSIVCCCCASATVDPDKPL